MTASQLNLTKAKNNSSLLAINRIPDELNHGASGAGSRDTLRTASQVRGSDPLAQFLQEANIFEPADYGDRHHDSVDQTQLQMMPLIIESTKKTLLNSTRVLENEYRNGNPRPVARSMSQSLLRASSFNPFNKSPRFLSRLTARLNTSRDTYLNEDQVGPESQSQDHRRATRSQQSRQNIKDNTKNIKCEIQSIDEEIALLESSMMGPPKNLRLD
jgi:hypothetical protein